MHINSCIVVTQKTRLTAKVIDKLSYSKQRTASGTWPKDIWWDTDVTGFGLRVYPTGKKSYIIEYRVNRKKRLKTIGEHGVLTPEQARNRAKKDLTGLLDDIDPMSVRDQAREAGTFAELASTYMERYAKPHKKTWRNDEGMLNKHLLPKFGTTPAISVTNTDVARLHLEVGRDHPYAANRFVELVSVIYRKGIQWGVLPKSLENPAHGIEHFKEEKRDRYVKPEEMPALMESIDLEDSIYVRNAIWMYLLTGLRKTELLTAKWEYLDIQRQELKLPDTKSDRAHYLPLSNDAIQLLNTTPRLEGTPYIFPGKNPGTHLVNIDKPWQRIRKRANIDDVRIHDLRRTLGSWLAQSGNSLHLIGRILNHADQKTTQVYARFQQDNLRAALDQHGSQIMGIDGKRPTAEIVPFAKEQ